MKLFKLKARKVIYCYFAAILALLLIMASSTGLAGRGEPLVEQAVCAGSAQDFMLVRHLKISGTNYQIGRAIARFAKADGIIPKPSGDPLKNRVELAYLKDVYPVFYERICGMADEYGIPVNDNRYNLSTLIQFSGAYGCSGVYYPPETTADGHGYLSRNFDFGTGDFQFRSDGERVTSRPVIMELHPDRGYATIAVCAYDLLGGAIDGINSRGLAVAIFADGIGAPGQGMSFQEIGLHELSAMRYLLDNCATLTEAKQALLRLKHYVSYASCHYLIADRSGDSFVFEFSPDRRQTHIIDSPKLQFITNHLLYPGAPESNNRNSLDRINLLQQAVALINKPDREQIAAINRKVANTYPGSINRTLWYSQYDITALSVRVRFYLGDLKNQDGSVSFRYSNPVELALDGKK